MPALQAFHHRKKKSKLTIEMDHDLAEQVRAYGVYYKDAYGAEVAPQELLMEITRQFFMQDGEFQRFRAKPPPREPKPATTAAA